MYYIQLGNITYEKSGGELFTLAECWRELDGVGNARIVAGDGRIVLERAGDHIGRRYAVRAMYRKVGRR
jgi:hypothetical protein